MDENNTQSNADEKDLKVLRTYSSDMAEAIRTNEGSVIKIALAERDKREQEDVYRKAEGTNFSKTILIIGGIILIIGAVWGSSFLIQKKKELDTPQPTLINNNIETFISYDSKLLLDTTTANNQNDLVSLLTKAQKGAQGLIQAIFFTKKTDTAIEVLNTNDFFSLIKTSAPGPLVRSLSDKYLFGKYSNINAEDASDKYATYLILQTTNYNQAYASMLDWEKTLLKDLYLIFNINIPKEDTIIFDRQWKDIIINNKDARVLYGSDGKAILYYVFINKNSFVITNSMEAVKELITRILIKNTTIQ